MRTAVPAARLLAVGLVTLASLALVPVTAGAAEVVRAGGDDRIGTAIAVSRAAFADGAADAVVVAAAGDFPDALAAAPLAAAAGGPVLLNPRDRLHPDVREEIRRVVADPGSATAFLMGGTDAQAARVDDDLEEVGLTVERVADDRHPDRFGTAAAAARRAAALWGGDAGDRVLVALGAHPEAHRAWPDALAAGALAGHARWPILLTGPGHVPPVTNAALRDLGTDHATLVGGPAAIPEDTADDLDVAQRSRIGGRDRYATSALLADEATRHGAVRATVLAATGGDFPDGLAAGPAAAALGGVTVLVARHDLVDSLATKTWFERHAGEVSTVRVAGGELAVSPETAGQIGFALTDLRLAFQEVASGLSAPVHVTGAPGDDRLFVVEQGGRIRTVGDAVGTFLDLTGRVVAGGERGLLGLAFHPDFASNGRFYVHYTAVAMEGYGTGHTRVEEYRAGSSSPQRVLLRLEQPASNHNGGHLEFGPDGALYLGLGDGGGADDQFGNAQDTGTLLGAIVRLDPDGTGGVNHLHGLRNPYRFSIDPVDEVIVIGDVGQDGWEEIDVVPYTAAGTDLGWPCREGSHDHRTGRAGCDGGYVDPVLDYPVHDGGTCAVTGGVVYRGSAIPELRGQYLYADHCAGWVRGLHERHGTVTDERHWFDTGDHPTGFGFGPDGEVHLALHGGTIVRIVRAGT